MVLSKNIIYFILLFSLFTLTAQRANRWYFGSNAGLNFNTSPPTALSNGLTTNPDNTSTISDSNGNLLFYTNGMTVWNSNHIVMPNGSGLIGNSSAGQCALIVPVPFSLTKYVIFHTTEFSSPGYLHYTMVDMGLNGGLGDVVIAQKNVSLGSGWTEKLCAYYYCPGGYYWVLTHKWGDDQFVAFKVDANSIATQSVTSSIGSVHNCGVYSGAHDAMGQLTISQDGSMVVNALTCLDKYELFGFNSSTGALSNSISIPGTGDKAWGTAFSPDSKHLFTNSIFGQAIFQYDLSIYNQATIISSQVSVLTVASAGYNFGYMELGPNNKLYIARPGNSFLAVINNPNAMGALSNSSLSGQSLGNNVSTHGLSRIAYNIPSTNTNTSVLTISVSSSSGNFSICPGQSISLNASGATSYTWSTNSNSSSISVSPTVTSVYTVTGAQACSSQAIGQVTVYVVGPPVITISGTPTVCAGNIVILNASGASSYTWNTGSTGLVLVATPTITTSYTVIGTNSTAGCTGTSSASYVVSPIAIPTLSLVGPTLVCYGQAASFSVSGASSYTWSTGISWPSITIYPTSYATYTVTGTSANGCKSSKVFTLAVNECVGLVNLDENQGVQISPNPVIDDLNIYFGQTNADLDRMQVVVMNTTGQILETKTGIELDKSVDSFSRKLNLKTYVKGIYLIKIQMDELIITKVILKE